MNETNCNIKELIDIIISLRKEKDKHVCCYPKSAYNDELCIHNCKECTDDYYKMMKSNMMKQYVIKE